MIEIGTRERYLYGFADRPVAGTRRALRCGDYGVSVGERLLAAVERRTREDLIRSLIDGSLQFAPVELSALAAATVVVEHFTYRLLAAALAEHGPGVAAVEGDQASGSAPLAEHSPR